MVRGLLSPTTLLWFAILAPLGGILLGWIAGVRMLRFGERVRDGEKVRGWTTQSKFKDLWLFGNVYRSRIRLALFGGLCLLFALLLGAGLFGPQSPMGDLQMLMLTGFIFSAIWVPAALLMRFFARKVELWD